MKKFLLAQLFYTKWTLLTLSFLLLAAAPLPMSEHKRAWVNNQVQVKDNAFSKVQDNYDMKVNYPGFLFHDATASYYASLKSQGFMSSAIQELRRKANSGGSSSKNSLEFTYKVYHQDNALVSVVYFKSIYLAGSTRPTTSCASMNYDFEGNKEFSLADLFLPGTDFEVQLSALLKKHTGCTHLNTERLLKNFSFNQKGMLFTMDDSVQGTCADHRSNIQIEWSEIWELLNHESPIVERALGR